MYGPPRLLTYAVIAAALAGACKPRGDDESSGGTSRPPGDTSQNPPGQSPPGQSPPGQSPPGQDPPGQNPPGQEPGTPVKAIPPSVNAGLPPASATGYLELDGEAVRLTPEQISQHLERTFGHTRRYQSGAGYTIDALVSNLGVALGGIDYMLASNRDPFPRTQTVLISRMLAWEVAVEVVLNHADSMRSPKLRIFDKVDLDRDRPDGAGAERWEAQLEDLYWRMFSRAPTAHEALACRNAFIILMEKHGNNTVVAWIGVVYALISTVEFWVL